MHIHQNGSDGYLLTMLLVAGNKVETRKLRTCQSLEGVSVVWGYTPIFIICRAYASKWLRWVLFFTFLWLLRLKVKKGSLAHDKTLFGRRFCCLVIYATLHNLPCICIKIAPTETVSLFLWVLELKLKKRSLEHGKTWLGRRFCCLVIYANLI